RVNQRGEFNVPIGRTAEARKTHFPTHEQLTNAAVALSSSKLRATTWEHTLALAEPGDFVFLDPPYYSDYLKDDIKYSAKAFGPEDHQQLAEYVSHMALQGVD